MFALRVPAEAPCGLEAWRLGGLEAWRLGSLEAWRLGGLEAWMLIGLQKLMGISRNEEKQMEMNRNE